MGHYSSFILRLWVEPNGTWRSGFIQHVATRDKRRFSTVSEMLDFITQYSTLEELSLPFALDGSDPPQAETETAGYEHSPTEGSLENT